MISDHTLLSPHTAAAALPAAAPPRMATPPAAALVLASITFNIESTQTIICKSETLQKSWILNHAEFVIQIFLFSIFKDLHSPINVCVCSLAAEIHQRSTTGQHDCSTADCQPVGNANCSAEMLHAVESVGVETTLGCKFSRNPFHQARLIIQMHKIQSLLFLELHSFDFN